MVRLEQSQMSKNQMLDLNKIALPAKSFNLQFYRREQMFYCGQKRQQFLDFLTLFISQPILFSSQIIFFSVLQIVTIYLQKNDIGLKVIRQSRGANVNLAPRTMFRCGSCKTLLQFFFRCCKFLQLICKKVILV